MRRVFIAYHSLEHTMKIIGVVVVMQATAIPPSFITVPFSGSFLAAALFAALDLSIMIIAYVHGERGRRVPRQLRHHQYACYQDSSLHCLFSFFR